MMPTAQTLSPAPDVSVGGTGYLHPAYAGSLEEFGTPRRLPRCGGNILERPIGKSGATDGIGCYPLFCCRRWSELGADLDELAGRLVTLALVVDPFADVEPAQLAQSFDRVIHYKDHLLVDLTTLGDEVGTRHHRYYARKALRTYRVEPADDPSGYDEEWSAMYANLVMRHAIHGIKAFSKQSFARQLRIPGIVMFRAAGPDGASVASHLWYVQGDVAYSHLAASTEAGYAARAPYALYYSAILAFREGLCPGVRWVQLGAGAGLSGNADDGLTQFKKGWANDSRPVYFCGRILDPDRYARLSQDAGAKDSSYFPAYRHGEMA